MLIKIHNAETGEIFEREMTDEELAQAAKDKALYELTMQNEAELQNKKLVLLDKLGITQEEAELLLTPNPQSITSILSDEA